MDMPWTEARDFAAALERIGRTRMIEAAIAARAAGAEEKDWKKWVDEVRRFHGKTRPA
jgi:hypothetical protein